MSARWGLQVADPLPECPGPDCGRPVRRDVAARNNGLCSSCASAVRDMVLFRTPRSLPPVIEGDS